MKHTMRFSVGGQTVDVPNDELEQFRTAAAEHGAEPDEVKSYRVDGKDVEVPDSQYEQFSAMAKERGATPQPLRRLSFADGSTRDFTMPELSKFLRSREWREDPRYEADRAQGEQGSVAWAGAKGALRGAAEGAVAGANSAASKMLAALPEAAASVVEAAGNALEGGGNAPNAVGKWLRDSGRGVKQWLNENVKEEASDRLGYTDALVKTGEIAGDAAAMAVKFAPAAVAGPAYTEAILATDGINAWRDTYDAAVEKGFSQSQANLAGACAGLINYFGGKILMKSGETAGAMAKGALQQFLLSGAMSAGVMGAQSAANKGIENIIEGRDFTSGMGTAAMEGAVEGGAFHVLNAVGHGGKEAVAARRESAEAKEMRRNNLLTVAEQPGGGEFLDRVAASEGMDEAVRARREGKDVSRKMAAKADLPDNMSAAERNAVVDSIVRARDAKAERNRLKMDDQQAAALAEDIAKFLPEGQNGARFESVWLEATKRVQEARELDDPQRRDEIVREAVKEVATPKRVELPEEAKERVAEVKARHADEKAAQEAHAEREGDIKAAFAADEQQKAREAKRRAKAEESADRAKAEEEARLAAEEQEKSAAEEAARRKAEEERPHAAVEEAAKAKEEATARGTRDDFPEYDEWLRKTGRKDMEKNWRKFARENGIDPETNPWKERGAEPVETPPPKTPVEAPRSAPSEEGTTTPPKTENAPQGAERGKETISEAKTETKAEVKTPEEPPKTPKEPPKAETELSKTESEPPKTAEQEAKETRREAFRNDPVLQRIDAEYKKAKTDAERNALRDAFEARAKELHRKGLKVPKDAAPTEPPKEAPAEAPAEAAKETPAEAPKEEPKVVTKDGEVTEVKPPADIDAEYRAMPYDQRVKAQGEYLTKEIATLEEAVKDKLDETKDYRGKHVGWTPKDGVDDLPPTVTVKVPGDGEFTVKNNPDGFALLKKVAAKFKPRKDGTAPSRQTVRPPSITIAKSPKAESAAKETEGFVSKDPAKKRMSKPFVEDGMVYATNGHIAVRRPLRAGEKVKGEADAPRASVLFAEKQKPTDKIDVAETYPKVLQALQTTSAATRGKAEGGNWVELWRGKDGKLHLRSRDLEGAGYATDGWSKDSKPIGMFNGEYLEGMLKLAAKAGAKEIECSFSKDGRQIRFRAGEWEGVFMGTRDGKEAFAEYDRQEAEFYRRRTGNFAERRWEDSLSEDARKERAKLVKDLADAIEEGAQVESLPFGRRKIAAANAQAAKDKASKALDDFDSAHGKAQFVEDFMKGEAKADGEAEKPTGRVPEGAFEPPKPAEPPKTETKAADVKSEPKAEASAKTETEAKPADADADMMAARALRERAQNDPELRRIDAAYRTAKTDSERAAIKGEFERRLNEIRLQRREERLKTRLADPRFQKWAKKNGVAPTKDHLEMFDREQAKGGMKLLKRWIRGLKDVVFENTPPTDEDIGANDRAMVVDDPSVIAQFDNDDGTVTLFRAVKIDPDGAIRPPQSTQVKGADGKLHDRPPEGYLQPDGSITRNRDGTGGKVVMKAEERPDLAYTRTDPKTGKPEVFTEADAKAGRCSPENVGKPKYFFDLKKGKTNGKSNGSTDGVLYQPSAHSSDTPFNDQFTSGSKRPDWRVVQVRVLKSDLESGRIPDKAAKSTGFHPWKGGVVDNQLPKNLSRKVAISDMVRLERLVTESEAADILAKKWDSVRDQLVLPESRLHPEMKKEMLKRGFRVVSDAEYKAWKAERGKAEKANIRYFRDVRGDIVGKWDRRSGKVTLYPGANEETVMHELGWHATYDLAEQMAAKGDRRLLDNMQAFAREADSAEWARTLSRYGIASDPAMLLDEVGAARFTAEHAMKIRNELDRRAALKWYGKAWEACKDAYKSMLTKMGFNKANLDALDGMTPEQVMDFTAKAMVQGKSLGKAEKRSVPRPTDDLTLKEKYVRDAKDESQILKWVDDSTGGQFNLHREQKLSHGAKQKATDKVERFVEKLTADMKKAGVKLSELDEYMRAKGAANTNARIKALNGRDNGAGISSVDAMRTVREYEHGPKAQALKDLSQRVWDLQHEGLMERVRAGLVTAEFASDLEAREPWHVPRHNRFDPNTGEFMGYDTNAEIAAAEWRKAKGRTTDAGNAVGWILNEYLDAFSRGADNRVRQRLAMAVAANPELGRAVLVTPANEAHYAEKTKYNKAGNSQVVIVKQGGRKVALELNGVRGEAVSSFFTGRDRVEMPKWLRSAVRFWASTKTEWSPLFALDNLRADLLDATLLHIADEGFVKGVKQAKQQIKNSFGMWRELWRYARTGKTNNPLLKEAIDNGILIGGIGRQGFTDPREMSIRFGDKLSLHSEEGLRNVVRRGKMGFKNVVRAYLGWVETLNKTTELATRLGDYKTQRDGGMRQRDSAAHARDITVDFNEKGRITDLTNTLYLFSNSTMGSAFRQTKSLVGRHWKGISATVLAMGFAEGLLEAFNGAEADEEKAGTGTSKDLNEFTRANSLYLRVGDTTVRWPFHAGPLSVIKYTGNCAARYMVGLFDKDNASALSGEKAAKNVGKEAAGIITHYLGLGGGGANIEQTLTPSILQWLVQLAQNTDYADRPIKKPKFDESKPDSANGRRSTPDVYKVVADAVNRLGGGNEGRKGEILGHKADYAPEVYKVVAESFGGNVLKDITSVAQVVGTVADFFQGNEVDLMKIPATGRVVRRAEGNTQRYYEAANRYRDDRYELRTMTPSWTLEERREYLKAHPWAASPELDKYIERAGAYQKLADGFVKDARGQWVRRKEPPTEEQRERWRAAQHRVQARFLEIAERHGGEH